MRLIKLTEDEYIDIDKVVAVNIDKMHSKNPDAGYRVNVQLIDWYVTVAENLTRAEADVILKVFVDKLNRFCMTGKENSQ